MLSIFIVGIVFLAATANTQPLTMALTAAETNTARVTTSGLVNTITTVVNGISRRAIVVIAEGHDHVSKVALAFIIIGVIIASFILIALIWRCIMYVNWEQLCGKMPRRTSKGVRDLERGISQNEVRTVHPGVEVAQSGGQPFMSKDVIGSKH